MKNIIGINYKYKKMAEVIVKVIVVGAMVIAGDCREIVGSCCIDYNNKETIIVRVGDRKEAIAGKCEVAIAGYWGTATAGNGGVAMVKDWGTATAGNGGLSIAGDWGIATVGNDGIAMAGRWGIISIGKYYNTIKILKWKTANVGENGIKQNTAYKLNDKMEFVECE